MSATTAAGTVLIVGASSGIGRATAEKLASEGASLVLAGRRDPGIAGTRFVSWDVTQPFPADSLPERLDGLLYCPGSIRLATFSRLSEQQFNDDLQINLIGAVRAIQAALPALKKSDHASIVLFSTVAVETGMPMHASVAAAKGAVAGLSRSLAAELAPAIRVNCIAPSLVNTPLAGSLLKTERQQQAAAERHPLKRIGQTDDIAHAATYLLNRDSSWITGETIAVDGGMSHVRLF